MNIKDFLPPANEGAGKIAALVQRPSFLSEEQAFHRQFGKDSGSELLC